MGLYRAGLKQNPGVWPGFCVRIKRVGCYFALFVVYQICGAPLTPDFSIAPFNSGDAANALACSRLGKLDLTRFSGPFMVTKRGHQDGQVTAEIYAGVSPPDGGTAPSWTHV